MKTQEPTLQGNSGPAVDGNAKPATAAHQSVTQRVAESAHESIDSAAQKADELETNLRAGAAKAGTKLEESQEAATEQVEKSLASIESFIKGRPIASAGIAFAAGILATALLRR